MSSSFFHEIMGFCLWKTVARHRFRFFNLIFFIFIYLFTFWSVKCVDVYKNESDNPMFTIINFYDHYTYLRSRRIRKRWTLLRKVTGRSEIFEWVVQFLYFFSENTILKRRGKNWEYRIRRVDVHYFWKFIFKVLRDGAMIAFIEENFRHKLIIKLIPRAVIYLILHLRY